MSETEKPKIKITIKDVFWNYAGSILNLGMNLIILPIILTVLPPNDLGLWYVFSSIAGLLSLVDFGFSPSISRSVTCAWCGAEELRKEGLDTLNENSSPNYNLLKSLTMASRKIYLIMATIAGFFLFTFGTYYIQTLTLNSGARFQYYMLAWGIYSISIVTNLYFSYWSSFLKGIGAIKQSNIITIISRSIFIAMSVVGLLLGGGLVAIALSLLISGVVLRLLSKKSFVKIVGSEFENVSSDSKNNSKNVFLQLLPSSSKYGIVAIGGFLSTRASTLLCSSFLGLDATASYGLTIQIFDLIGSLTQLLFHSYSPMITSARIENDQQKVKKLFSVTVVFQLIFGCMGIGLLVIFGKILLNFVGANANLLPMNILLILGLVLLFEWNTSLFMNFIMTSNRIPFAKASIISGVMTSITTYLLLKHTSYGVWSIVIGRGIVGFIFNNWYWPKYVCRELNLNVINLLIYGYKTLFAQIKQFFVLRKNQNIVKKLFT